jgi:hypothetical protein
VAQEENGGVEITTPWGGMKGKRTAEVITIILAIAVAVLAYAFHVHGQTSDANEKKLVDVLERMTAAQDKNTRALREQTCIFAQPAEKREREFMSPDGLCKRMAQ